ncbi:hypothetical protein [Cellulophaga sp. F20128]|uniref:hypothetical protein n=1 Tax=Cellulophaga sp. F20128 TaxID=2926413 RepID=UPI0032B14D88
MTKDAWRTKNYWDKIRIWFMPTGWRPADVKDKYPIKIIENVYDFKRYDTEASSLFKGYSVFQMLVTLMLMLYMFYNFQKLGFNDLLLFGAFLFVGIYGYTTLMDGKKYAVWIEALRSVLGIGYILA